MNGWHLSDLLLVPGFVVICLAAGGFAMVVMEAVRRFVLPALRRWCGRLVGALVAAVRLRFGGAR